LNGSVIGGELLLLRSSLGNILGVGRRIGSGLTLIGLSAQFGLLRTDFRRNFAGSFPLDDFGFDRLFWFGNWSGLILRPFDFLFVRFFAL
jgi:hypothetical protein